MKTILTRLALLSLIIPVVANCYAGDQRNIPRLKTGNCCTSCEGSNGDQPTGGVPQAQMNLGGGGGNSMLGDIRLATHAEKPSPILFSPGGISVGGSNGIPMLLNVRENANGSTSIESQEECELVRADVAPGQDADTVPLSCDGTLTGIEVTAKTAFNFSPMIGGNFAFLMSAQPLSSGGNKVVFIKKPDGRSARYSMAGEMISYTAANGHTTVLADLPVEQRTEIIRPNGELRQVKTPNGLADVQVLPGDNQGYVVNYYEAAQVGAKGSTGLYTCSGAPARSLRVENPEWQEKKYAKANITTTTGAVSRTNSYSYNDANREWTQILPDGTKIVKRDTVPQNTAPAGRTSAINHFERTKERYAADGTLIGRTKYVIWLTKDEVERVLFEIKDEGGLNATTTYDYYTDAGNAKTYAQLKSKQNFDGSWEYYTYDVQGRIAKRYSPWLDTSFPANVSTNEAGYRVSEYSYTPVASGDVLLQNDQRARALVQRINGIETGRTYYAYPKIGNGETQEITEKAVAQGVAFGYTGNLRVTTTYYGGTAGEASAGKIKTILQPDNQLTTYSYTLNPNVADAYLTIAETQGTASSPAGIANKTIRRVRTQNTQGLTVREEMQVYVGGDYVRVTLTESRYDEDKHLVESKKDGRIVFNAIYANDKLISETDEIGITTTYTYDAMGDVATATRQPVGDQPARVTTYNRTLGGIDCGCDGSLQITVNAGGLTLSTRMVKDKVGRLVEQVDEVGLTKTCAYTQGGRVTTIIQPNTASQVMENHLDGQVKSVTGTSVVAQYKTYGINPEGTKWVKIAQAEPNGPRWTKSTSDFLGRELRTERPGYGGAVLTTIKTYNTQNQLTVSEHICTVGTAPALSGWNQQGNAHRLAFIEYMYDELGHNIVIQPQGQYATQQESFFTVANGAAWQESWTKQYDSDTGPAFGVVTQRIRQRLNPADDTVSEVARVDIPGAGGNDFSWDSAGCGNYISTTTVTLNRAAQTQIVTTKYPSSIQSEIATSIGGQLVSTVSSSHGGTTLYHYDALGRQTGIKQPRHANYSTTEYLPGGQVRFVTDAAGNQTKYSYYGNGAVGAGQLRQATDPLGGTVFHQYDLLNREIYTWGSATYPVAQGYDAYGQRNLLRTYRDTAANFIGSTFPANAQADTTAWTYDPATGVLLCKTYADNQGPTYDYYASGQLRTRTWARKDTQGNPLVTTYAYDQYGRPSQVTYSDNTPAVTYTYNMQGQQTAVTDGAGTRAYSYDPTTRALTTEGFSGVITGMLDRTYDAYSRPASLALRDSTYAVTYGYDANGRLSQIGGSGGHTYVYLPNSDLIATVAGPVCTAENTYESNRDNLLAKTNRINSGGVVSQYNYTVDVLGRRTARAQSGNAFFQAYTETLAYNSRSEMTSATNNQNATLDRKYNYDPIGNRISAVEGAVSGVTKAYGSNVLNQYSLLTTNGVSSQPTYDRDGNMLSDGVGKTYTWDGENRLVQVSLQNGSIIRYTYDAQSRRVKREHVNSATTKTTTYLYDGWNVIREITGGNTKTYVWGRDLSGEFQGAGGIGGLLRMDDSGLLGKMCYSYDGNGNVSELIGSDSGVLAHYEYDVFGKETVAVAGFSQENHYRFSTKPWDAEAGLNYYGYRFYQPKEGRWINRDPIEERGDINVYGFITNNATNSYDYLGLIGNWGPIVLPPGRGGFPPYPVPTPPPNKYPIGFSLCKRDFAEPSDFCEKCINGIINTLVAKHFYIQYIQDPNTNPDIGPKPPWGIGFGGGPAATTETTFNPSSCKSCSSTGALLGAGSGRGKSASSASDDEIKDCLVNTKPSQSYDYISYNCQDWSSEALKNCGLNCK